MCPTPVRHLPVIENKDVPNVDVFMQYYVNNNVHG